jgi:cation:H+ antiporter
MAEAMGSSDLLLGLIFVLGVVVSLGSSWVLVVRLERVGSRLGLSEGLLGMLAALAADTPEITAAVTALVRNGQRVGAGVVIGSNVFNLAALLGLSAVVAGHIALHRRVVEMGGALNSNALNVTAGLLLPTTILGLGVPSGQTTFVAASYLALTAFVLVAAYVGRGLRRPVGLMIIAAYLAFAAALVATT